MTTESKNAKADCLFAIIDEMLRVKNCFETIFAELHGASELSTLQKLVLTCVLDASVPPTVPQIGRYLGNPRQVVQRIVNELIKLGLVRKTVNPHHRRASLLLPTGKAERLRDQAEERAAMVARDMLGNVGIDHCRALASELRALRRAMESYTDAKSPDAAPMEAPVSLSRALALL